MESQSSVSLESQSSVLESQSHLFLESQSFVLLDSSFFIQMANLELSVLAVFKDNLFNSTTSVYQTANKVMSYNYRDGSYTEQEAAAFEHKDEANKTFLVSQIEVNMGMRPLRSSFTPK